MKHVFESPLVVDMRYQRLGSSGDFPNTIL